MKKIAFLLCALLCLGSAHASGTAKGEIIVSAAASLTDAMNELIGMYKKIEPNLKVTPTYGSSGALQKQIEQGAPVDVFISAAPKQMNALEQLGLLSPNTRKDLLLNQVVLIIPKDSKSGITQFADLAGPQVKQIALGEPGSVPVGQYSEEIFTALGILDAVKAKVVYAKDVRQVLTYVEIGEVDAGVVYATDAAVSSKIRILQSAPAGTHSPIVYPAALIKSSAQSKAAGDFLQWLSTPGASDVFKKYGFSIK